MLRRPRRWRAAGYTGGQYGAARYERPSVRASFATVNRSRR
jgi:hypothetical protein